MKDDRDASAARLLGALDGERCQEVAAGGAVATREAAGEFTVERIARRVMPDAERVIAFHAILSGSCWVSLEDASAVPFLANAGDVLVVPGGAAHMMGSSRELRGNPDLALYYRPVDALLPFKLTEIGRAHV